MIIGCWNIRGLNHPSKQSEIAKFVFSNHLDVLGITKSKVHIPNQDRIQKTLLPSWKFVSNSQPNAVDRIWVGWNPDKVNITVILNTPQIIHVSIASLDLSIVYEASFIYGLNTIQDRRSMWTSMRTIFASAGGTPWISLGDRKSTRLNSSH